MAKAAAKKATTPKSKLAIDSAATQALEKLQALELDPGLRSDLAWCIGSYQYDRIPTGLQYHMQRAIAIFNELVAKKTKGVTQKWVSELEAAIQ